MYLKKIKLNEDLTNKYKVDFECIRSITDIIIKKLSLTHTLVVQKMKRIINIAVIIMNFELYPERSTCVKAKLTHVL